MREKNVDERLAVICERCSPLEDGRLVPVPPRLPRDYERFPSRALHGEDIAACGYCGAPADLIEITIDDGAIAAHLAVEVTTRQPPCGTLTGDGELPLDWWEPGQTPASQIPLGPKRLSGRACFDVTLRFDVPGGWPDTHEQPEAYAYAKRYVDVLLADLQRQVSGHVELNRFYLVSEGVDDA